ncbi:hypothetical protein L3X38_038474 [Prunus dulcis]|uniref:Uncharacterized protein n=1 Tax=Prunus dulcis TaxID=3755 RepID=A0AAD4V7I3_PRUDU|nr:hypothetical protein L3X38_038474 [Prunus dulcis]
MPQGSHTKPSSILIHQSKLSCQACATSMHHLQLFIKLNSTKHVAAGRRTKYSSVTGFSLEMHWAYFSLRKSGNESLIYYSMAVQESISPDEPFDGKRPQQILSGRLNRQGILKEPPDCGPPSEQSEVCIEGAYQLWD